MNATLLALWEGVISIYIKIYETNFRPQYNLNDLCRCRTTTIKITEIDCTSDININVDKLSEAQCSLYSVASKLAAKGSTALKLNSPGWNQVADLQYIFKLPSSIKPFMAMTNFQVVSACFSRPYFFVQK